MLPGSASAATFSVPGFEEQTIVSGLTEPMAVDWLPDGSMLVAEKPGVLKIVPPGGSTASVLLDISDRVNTNGERGLLGLAVDSDFGRTRYVYLLYTYDVAPGTPDSPGAMASRLTRIRLDAAYNVMNPASPETVLLGKDSTSACPATPANDVDCIPSDSRSHSIGTVLSDPDGTLWVSSGEGAEYNFLDPRAFRAYDEASPAGKILRVDRNGKGVSGHPFCPANTNLDQVCTKVYAKGFRNPFRMTLSPAGLVVGDVGWNRQEELDVIGSGGGDYGWPCYEGSIRTPEFEDRDECKGPAGEYSKEGTPQAARAPDYAYPHNSTTRSIVGGPVYLGREYPRGYRGTIFFGDFTDGTLKRLVAGSGGGLAETTLASGWSGVALVPGPGGDLVYVDITGSVKRIVYAPGNAAPRAAAVATPDEGTASLTVRLDASASTDADGDPLSYRWSFGDGTPGASGATVRHTYPSPGVYTAAVVVDDGRGKTARATRRISVSARPRPRPPGDDGAPGPALSFSSFSARSGILRGRVSDPDGVARVYVAVGRRGRARRRCRWWFPSLHRLSRRSRRCSRPRWIRAKVAKGRWKASLRRRRVPAGAYRVVFKAADAKGNASRKLRDGRSIVRVRAPRRR